MTSFGQYFSCTRSWSQGGCRTRPSIRWQDPNMISDTGRGALSKRDPKLIFFWDLGDMDNQIYSKHEIWMSVFLNNPLLYRVLCLFRLPHNHNFIFQTTCDLHIFSILWNFSILLFHYRISWLVNHGSVIQSNSSFSFRKSNMSGPPLSSISIFDVYGVYYE